jgi:phosphatidylserine/phosphatidylglycerophosphate/cardiolipin synthase-like enzyme
MSVAGALLDLPPHLQERLAGALESGLLTTPYPAASIRAALGLVEESQAISDGLADLDGLGMTGAATAAWIRAVSAAAGKTPRPDLVWSGPEVPGLYARDTRRVFEELLSSAQRSIWVCTYAYFDGRKAFELLASRMDESRELQVTLLLNIQRRRGDTTAEDQLVRAFAERLWKTDWPGTARPRVFFDPRSLDEKGPSGVLHAKAVVTDDESVFVTSANLTEAALDRNIEMGVLYRDRAFALGVTSHFRVLIDRKLLLPLPVD